MIKEFDKQNLKTLRSDMDVAIAAVASKYGIVIRLGNIRYDSVKAASKIEFVVTTAPDGTTTTNSREAIMAADFKRNAESFGLKPEQYGTIFKHGRDSYKLVGLKPRAPKMPILATNVATGVTYKLPESAVTSLQTAEYKELYGIGTLSLTTCANDAAFDAKFNPIGKCNRPVTSFRKSNFGRSIGYCTECAQQIDEARAENAAEGRAS
jgi:hypothetical protein